MVKKGANIFWLIAILILLTLSFACQPFSKKASLAPQVKVGAEVFLAEYLHLVKGKNVGLVTNPSAVDSQIRPIIDLFFIIPK